MPQRRLREASEYFEERYPVGYGVELRKRKREFERGTAKALAKAGMAETEREEVGATKRRKMVEAGLGERLGREQEFARPAQRAAARKTGAEAEKIRYGTEFEKGLEGSLEDIIKARAEEAGIGVSEARREIRLRDEGEVEAARISDIEEAPMVEPAKPRRKLRPSIARPLFGGPPLKRGFEAPPLLAPTGGWGAFKDFLNLGVKKGYEWAFPRGD